MARLKGETLRSQWVQTVYFYMPLFLRNPKLNSGWFSSKSLFFFSRNGDIAYMFEPVALLTLQSSSISVLFIIEFPNSHTRCVRVSIFIIKKKAKNGKMFLAIKELRTGTYTVCRRYTW